VSSCPSRYQRGQQVAAGLLAVAVLVTGCGARVSSTARDGFLAAIHDEIPNINHYKSDTSLVRLGQAACAELSSGASFGTVTNQLQGSSPSLPLVDLATVVRAATSELCPRYASRTG
jgi:hypothetical protein